MADEPTNPAGPIVVQNQNDPVRVINAAASAVTALLVAYFTITGKAVDTAKPAAPVLVEPTPTETLKQINARFDSLDAKVDALKPVPKK